MSLKIQSGFEVPEETASVAQSIFPDGNLYMQLYEHFKLVFEDQDFSELYPPDGQPALSPTRLLMVLILQFAEGLSDRQAAEAVRTRIDWKYLLCLPLRDKGFHYSVLSEFRTRLIQGRIEQMLLNKLLRQLQEAGLLRSRGSQRTDSTHVIGAVQALTRLELVRETMRYILNRLSVEEPEWMRSHGNLDWVDRYWSSMAESRLPKSKEQQKCATSYPVGQNAHFSKRDFMIS